MKKDFFEQNFLAKTAHSNKNLLNLEYIECPICHSGKDFVLSKKGYPGIPVRNVICRSCGLIRINPRMTQKGYEDFYKSDFFTYLDPFNRPAYVNEIENTIKDGVNTPTKEKIIPFLDRYINEGAHVLDIGAGFGQVLYLLKKGKNIDFVGIEPDPNSRKIAKEKMGIKLLDTTIEDFLKTNNSKFDCIILNQTFEHLLHPLLVLKQLSKILKKDGIIYIGVPNAYNPLIPMKLFYQLAHTYNYTPHTLNLFARMAHLKIIESKGHSTYPLEVIMTHVDDLRTEISQEFLDQGSSWVNVVFRLKLKKIKNQYRSLAGIFLEKMLGKKNKEKVRSFIDRLIRYKY